jgi:hypothetical protein
MKIVYVARKLCTIEERRQDQSCLFRRGDYRNKTQNPVKLLGSIPSEDGFCSSETKHDRRMVPGLKLFVFARRLQEQRPQHQKRTWVRVLMRMVSVARKLSMREERCQGKICFGEEIAGTKVTDPKTVLGLSPTEVGFSSSETKQIRTAQ